MNPSAGFRIVLAVLLLLTTFFSGWIASERYRVPVAVATMAHPARRQADGSLLAARVATPQAAKQVLPAGDRVLDTARIQLGAVPTLAAGIALAPATSGAPAVLPVTPQLVQECRRILRCEVTADESLLATPGGQQDLAVSTPDGRVETAILAPASPLRLNRPHPWLLGASDGRSGAGLVLGREFQELPLDLSLDVYRDGRTGVAERLSVAWRF